MQFQNSELHINNLTTLSAEEEQCINVPSQRPTSCVGVPRRPAVSLVSPWPRISVSMLTSPESQPYYWIKPNSASLLQRRNVSATWVPASPWTDWRRPVLRLSEGWFCAGHSLSGQLGFFPPGIRLWCMRQVYCLSFIFWFNLQCQTCVRSISHIVSLLKK